MSSNVRPTYPEAMKMITDYLDKNAKASGIDTSGYKLGMAESLIGSLMADFETIEGLIKRLQN